MHLKGIKCKPMLLCTCIQTGDVQSYAWHAQVSHRLHHADLGFRSQLWYVCRNGHIRTCWVGSRATRLAVPFRTTQEASGSVNHSRNLQRCGRNLALFVWPHPEDQLTTQVLLHFSSQWALFGSDLGWCIPGVKGPRIRVACPSGSGRDDFDVLCHFNSGIPLSHERCESRGLYRCLSGTMMCGKTPTRSSATLKCLHVGPSWSKASCSSSTFFQ